MKYSEYLRQRAAEYLTEARRYERCPEDRQKAEGAKEMRRWAEEYTRQAEQAEAEEAAEAAAKEEAEKAEAEKAAAEKEDAEMKATYKNRQYTQEELVAFINRAENLEMLHQADEVIHKMTMPDEMLEELEMELLGSYDMMNNPAWGCSSYDEDDYGPSNPWDAPGMRVSDFITGVRCW